MIDPSSDSYKLAKQFLEHHMLGVIGTVSRDGIPHTATIYYSIDDDMNFYFFTKSSTRKSQNIVENPNVSFTVYDAVNHSTVQMQGVAEQVDQPSLSAGLLERVINKESTSTDSMFVPPVARLDSGNLVVYKITPKHLRYAVYDNSTNYDKPSVLEDII